MEKPATLASQQQRTMQNRRVAAGIFFIIVGGTLPLWNATFGLGLGLLFIVCGAWMAAFSIWARSVGESARILNAAVNLIGLGKLGEAERLLTEHETQLRSNRYRVVMHTHMAVIALRRGDLRGSLGQCNRALATPLPWAFRIAARVHLQHALAVRAFVLACLDERERARADIDELSRDPVAQSVNRGIATVAEAVLLERSGNRHALGEHLQKNRRLLLEATHPRERAIIRAYQRMLKTKPGSVYRARPTQVDSAPSENEPPLLEWMKRVAPSAAAFVAVRKQIADEQDPPALDASPSPAAKKALEAMRSGAGRSKRVVARILAVFVLLGLIAFCLASLGGPAEPGRGTIATWFLLPMFAVVIGTVALLIVRLLRVLSQHGQLMAVLGRFGQGDDEEHVLALSPFLSNSNAAFASTAHLQLAHHRERQSRFAEALVHSESGLQKNPSVEPLTAANLIGERAFLLTVLDRPDEAAAEIAALKASFPDYAYLDRDLFRVRLVGLVRRGELAHAAALADRRGDLPLNPRVELLADAVRAAVHPEAAGAGELARIKEDLRIDLEARRWLEAVAPAVIDLVEKTTDEDTAHETAETDHAAQHDPSSRDAAAEAEALAESEDVELARHASRAERVT